MEEGVATLRRLLTIRRQNTNAAIIADIQRSSLPVVLYGAGEHAEHIYQILQKNGIKPQAAFVDEEYFSTEKKISLPVLHLRDICANFKEFSIVYAVVSNSNFTQFRQVKNIQNIYIFPKKYYSLLELDFLKNNLYHFENVLSLLCDNFSKNIFIKHLQQKITGEYMQFDIYNKFQYFPPDIIHFAEDEVFIDAGAYTGDTLCDFVLNIKNKYKEIYCFEPDSQNFLKLINRIKDNNYKNILPYNGCVWSEDGSISFSGGSGSSSHAIDSKKTENIQAYAIDNLRTTMPITFIKMDIEGAELDALQGARETIMKYKPKLAICLYHKPEHLFEIPEYLHSIQPDYQFHVRRHSRYPMEFVPYAV